MISYLQLCMNYTHDISYCICKKNTIKFILDFCNKDLFGTDRDQQGFNGCNKSKK